MSQVCKLRYSCAWTLHAASLSLHLELWVATSGNMAASFPSTYDMDWARQAFGYRPQQLFAQRLCSDGTG